MQTFAILIWPWIWQLLGFIDQLPMINPWFRFITGGGGQTSRTDESEADFVQIITEHSRLIHHRVCAYADSREDREDLLQEIILRLWRRYPTYRHDSKLSTWMYTVATGTAKSWRKRKGNLIEFGNDLPEGTYVDISNTR
jgi:DNA-directed RNA polymerase specialized sigma24 family protein